MTESASRFTKGGGEDTGVGILFFYFFNTIIFTPGHI